MVSSMRFYLTRNVFRVPWKFLWITALFMYCTTYLFRENNRTNSPVNSCNARCVLTLYWTPHYRLGNMFFQYATLYGIAKELGVPAVISTTPKFELCSLLRSQLDLPCFEDSGSQFHNYAFSIGGGRYSADAVQELQRDCNRPMRIPKILQSFKYFKSHENEIRRQFACRPSLKLGQQRKLARILAGRSERFLEQDRSHYRLVGVHIRLGDYTENTTVALGFKAASKEYLDKAMVRMEQELQHRDKTIPLFLIFGNDFEWNEENYGWRDDVLVVESGSALEDYCLMSMLNHTIMTVGTYGWWAAYMAGGLVIYDKAYARNGSWTAAVYNTEDFFPPDWIGI